MSQKVGFVGWRGMVGSVLTERMQAENDFEYFTPTYFSTSQAGQKTPEHLPKASGELGDAKNIEQLKEMDIVLTCQGGDYTNEIHPKLRASGWNGLWIDAASALRMSENSLICLDPLNKELLQKGLNDGVKDFIGGNCTVSLMLMGLGGLFNADLVEWGSAMTYQAASGGGARHMRELLLQMRSVSTGLGAELDDLKGDILKLDQNLKGLYAKSDFPKENFKFPLAGGLLPWIDTPMESGQSREEWKAEVEANKILGRSDNPVPLDGTCVRIGSMRCHSQALMLKMKKKVSVQEASDLIAQHNEWVEVVPNEPEATNDRLNPVNVSGTLRVPVGRIRQMSMGEEYLNVFTSGDQLLWGAAEPLRRMLRISLGA